MYEVEFSKNARKSIDKLPAYIVTNLYEWIFEVKSNGLEETRKLPGYHDEPLKGGWKGYRSVRLSRSYRAIYRENSSCVRLVTIVEVNKHDY